MSEESELKTIYLAGGKSDWRDEFKVTGATLINPMDWQTDYNAYPFDYVTRDVTQLRDCNFVVACHDYRLYSGLSAELGMAFAWGIPAIFVTKMERVDMFLASLCLSTFTDVGAAAEFVQDRWLK